MSRRAAQHGMRALIGSLIIAAMSCASPPAPATPAVDVAAGPTATSSPSILERARQGYLFADAGPDGAAVVDPHAGHHGHHGHHAAPAPVVDAGTP